MEENLVGYLLQSLDPDTHREVDNYLHLHPEARYRLELLERALGPLAADADAAPPPGLRVRTLARIAEYQCRELPPAPQPTVGQKVGPRRHPWRLVEMLIAASILLCVVGLSLPLLNKLWYDYQVHACKNNLRLFHQALMGYSELHDHNLPKIQEGGPVSMAGMFVPILNDAGVLGPDLSVDCPTMGRRPPSRQSVEELKRLFKDSPAEFRGLVCDLAGCYAYTLGYQERDATGHYALFGLRSDSGDALPIMADRPPFSPGAIAGPGNSLNHGGKGQNVLFLDGSVRFCTQRTVGKDGDDIYVNKFNRVEAGQGRWDTVLGASWASPVRRDDE